MQGNRPIWTCSPDRVMCAITLFMLLIACCRCSGADTKGLWIMPRKDACNTGRADIAGQMKDVPREIWVTGYDPEPVLSTFPVELRGDAFYLSQVRYGLQLRDSSGHIVWGMPNIGISSILEVFSLPGSGIPVALGQFGDDTLRLIDLSAGKIIWEWQTPNEASLRRTMVAEREGRIRLITFPCNSGFGCCFEISRDSLTPKLLWKTDISQRCWNNFGPTIAMADMNRDSIEEIVISGKPGYMGVIDQDTGKIIMDIRYDISGMGDIGRPYGLFGIGDMDGDGYPDLVMASRYVEEYIGVVKNVQGKELRLAWSKFISLDFPTEKIKVRPSVRSFADVTGDGKSELIISFHNDGDDNRWKTVIFDGMDGYDKRRAELLDRYLIGCYDINGDGISELITTVEKSPDLSRRNLVAVDGKTLKDITSVDASPEAFGYRLPRNVGQGGGLESGLYVTKPDGTHGLLVTREQTTKLWRIVDGKSVLEDFQLSALASSIMYSEGTGVIKSMDVSIPTKTRTVKPSVSSPLVAMYNGEREFIFAQSNGIIVGGVPDLADSGKFTKSWQIPGSIPLVWLGPDGRRIVCVISAGNQISLYEPDYQTEVYSPIAVITTPHPIKGQGQNRSGISVMPYGGKEFRLFVGMQLGAHAVAGAVYDINGKMLWKDGENGPHPRSPAADDLDGDGVWEVVLDNHSQERIYTEDGKSKLYAYGWHNDIPNRYDGAKYALPIIGNFGPSGEKRMVLSGGLESVETVNASGDRIAKFDLPTIYELQWNEGSVARSSSGGRWILGMANKFGLFSCIDIETCKRNWTHDFDVNAWLPISISTADVDGDGHDNFLVSLATGQLVVLDQKDGKASVLWQLDFDTPVTSAFVADLDGDGVGELIVELHNGFIRVFK